MATLLQLNNSLFGDSGKSSQLADAFVDQLRKRQPDLRLIRRDLVQTPVPHLTEEAFSAAGTAVDQRSPAQAQAAQLADTLIAELMEADILVIGLPVYNFNLPSTLKAWFDRVARAGTSFRYGSGGPEGLLAGKKAYVFVSSGGQYADTPADFQGPYLRHFLGFLGISDVTFTYAEGLAGAAANADQAMAGARDQISGLAAVL